MIKNFNILWVTIILILFNNNINAQCLEGAIPPSNPPLRDASFFSSYTPSESSSQIVNFNSGGGGTDKKDIAFQIDGQSSIQVKFDGLYHFYNQKPAQILTGYNNSAYNGFIIIYKGSVYRPLNSDVNPRIDSETSSYYEYQVLSVSTVTGTGTLTDPFKAKISYYADVDKSTGYNVSTDILVNEIITYVKGNKFLRRDRQIIPPTGNTSPIKLYDFRDAAFTQETDAGYALYSTGGIASAKAPPNNGGSVTSGHITGDIINNLNFIGITNKEYNATNAPTAVLLGMIEITPWQNWYSSKYSLYNDNSTATGAFNPVTGNATNYIAYYDDDIGYGVQYNSITDATINYISLYEVVTTPCTPMPTITTQPAATTNVCTGATATLSVSATPNLDGDTLTYQWYSNTTNSTTTGTATAITNETNNTFTIPTNTAGTFYYFVKITESGGGVNTSNVSTVTVSSPPNKPSLTVTPAACDVAGTAKIVSYNSSYTYTFNPATSGISIASDGTISGLTYGTSYTITASNGTCNSTTSDSFTVDKALFCPYFEFVGINSWTGNICDYVSQEIQVDVMRTVPKDTLPKELSVVLSIAKDVVDINTVFPKITFFTVDADGTPIEENGLTFFDYSIDKVNGTITFTLKSIHPKLTEGVDYFTFSYYAKAIKNTSSGYNIKSSILENGQTVFESTLNDIRISNNCVTAQNDINQAPAGVAVKGNVLTNDETGSGTLTVTAISYTKPDGTAGTYSFPSGTTTTTIAVQGGSLTINDNGTYTFTPDAGYTGTVNIGYTASNGSTSANANLSISVAPPIVSGTNSAPVANNDTATTEAGTAVTSNLLSNDSDPDGNTISITKVNGTTVSGTSATITVTGVNLDGTVNNDVGTLVLNPTTGAYTFTPKADFAGTVDPITYTISDGNGGTDTATLNISIVANTGNQVFANDDADLAPKGTTMTGNVLTNDSDPEGNAMSVSSATANGTAMTIGSATEIPNIGTLTLNSDGNYSFVPFSNFVGTVPVKYTVCSGSPQVCDEATLYLTSIELPVIANDDTRTVNSGTSDTTSVLGNDTYNGNPATLTDVTISQVSTTNTGVTIDTATGLVSVAAGTPDGTYTVVYKICTVNTPTYCDTASITVTVANECFEQPATKGTPLSTKHGITSMKRAGANNGNWPMLRNSAHTALESKTKGFVITRMTTEQINQIQNPVEGMLVFDKVANCLKLYVDNAWSCITTQACPN